MNANESIFYQFYPLGLCRGTEIWPPISIIKTWVSHLKKLGVNAVYFSPVFQSDNHGYDTQDFYKIDGRLGTNADFADLCTALHENGISVMLDGVFNHVGRGFWAFKDVQQKKQNSAFKDWFILDFNRNSNYNDGFWYEGWEGHFDLVKLNLKNPDVQNHIFGAIQEWKKQFGIDALRLDVAYCLDEDFLKKLHTLCKDAGIFVLGETIHSDSMNRVKCGLLDSATNYEVYKGIHSSLNSQNFFEISYSLNRLFGEGGIFKDFICTNPLMNFLDNHDVSRIATILGDRQLLSLAYTLLFTVPGFPCIYYGSEWLIEGNKAHGDEALRPALKNPLYTDFTDFVSTLAKIRKSQNALKYGDYKNLFIANKQLVFKRSHTDPFTGKYSEVIVALNCDRSAFTVQPKESGYGEFCGLYGVYKNLFTEETISFSGPIELSGKTALILKKC